MSVGGFNVSEVIAQIQKDLESDKSISPALRNSIKIMITILHLLVERLSLNSSNSSLSPSTDKFKKKSRIKTEAKKKKKSNKSVGGQTGHDGLTLEKFPEDQVDEIIEIELDQRTLPQGEGFKKTGVESRQVIDVILDLKITEYQAEVWSDAKGNHYAATFPNGITKAIQYGPSVKSFATYLSQYQLIPYARVQEVFQNSFGLPISQGTLYNFNKEAYEKLFFFEEEVKQTLSEADVAHADETGIQIVDKNHWLHVICTAKTTYFFPHEKRGQDAMKEMGILKDFKGVLCHDHWKPYFGMTSKHSLCNAHHLRELQWVIDFKNQKWAKSMLNFLIKTNELVIESGGELSQESQGKRIKRYRQILLSGKKECPFQLPAKGSRKNKVKQTKERNLLDRLEKFEHETLYFMRQKNVPFTNNQAERDIRMVKVHQKVSGCFRSMAGAKYFARIRSYLLTTKKRGGSPIDAINQVFTPKLAE